MTIRENLLQAINQIAVCPVETLNLENWVDETPCGTLYCAAGLLGTIPFFMDQGLVLHRLHGRSRSFVSSLKSVEYRSIMETIFGDSAFERIFACKWYGVWDHNWSRGINDKQLILNRLEKQLENYGPWWKL